MSPSGQSHRCPPHVARSGILLQGPARIRCIDDVIGGRSRPRLASVGPCGILSTLCADKSARDGRRCSPFPWKNLGSSSRHWAGGSSPAWRALEGHKWLGQLWLVYRQQQIATPHCDPVEKECIRRKIFCQQSLHDGHLGSCRRTASQSLPCIGAPGGKTLNR